jgi:hypothetical protein
MKWKATEKVVFVDKEVGQRILYKTEGELSFDMDNKFRMLSYLESMHAAQTPKPISPRYPPQISQGCVHPSSIYVHDSTSEILRLVSKFRSGAGDPN